MLSPPANKMLVNEPLATNNFLLKQSNDYVSFRLHAQPQSYNFTFENEDNPIEIWQCRSIRYKFLLHADGQIPTALELPPVTEAIDLLHQWSASDRFYYLLKDTNNEGIPSHRAFLFGSRNCAVGMTVLRRNGNNHLLIFVHPNVNEIINFLDNKNFNIGNKMYFNPRL